MSSSEKRELTGKYECPHQPKREKLHDGLQEVVLSEAQRPTLASSKVAHDRRLRRDKSGETKFLIDEAMTRALEGLRIDVDDFDLPILTFPDASLSPSVSLSRSHADPFKLHTLSIGLRLAAVEDVQAYLDNYEREEICQSLIESRTVPWHPIFYAVVSSSYV